MHDRAPSYDDRTPGCKPQAGVSAGRDGASAQLTRRPLGVRIIREVSKFSNESPGPPSPDGHERTPSRKQGAKERRPNTEHGVRLRLVPESGFSPETRSISR